MSTLNQKQRSDKAGKTFKAKERNALDQRNKTRTWWDEKQKQSRTCWNGISEQLTELVRRDSSGSQGCELQSCWICLYAESGMSGQNGAPRLRNSLLFCPSSAKWNELGCLWL